MVRGEKDTERVALVTGATGIQGRAIVELMDQDEKDWAAIYAVSRRPLDYDVKRAKHIRLDLNDTDAIKQVLKDDKLITKKITHIFHLAFAMDTTNIDQSVADWLKKVVEAAEATGHPLQHVFYEEGIKYYGAHWGAPKTPFREDDPRHLPPNFYYPAEDYLIERATAGVPWTWSALRPGAIFGFSISTKMDLLQDFYSFHPSRVSLVFRTSEPQRHKIPALLDSSAVRTQRNAGSCALQIIAVYGTICKELGIAMRYPGTPTTYYNTVQEAVDSKLLMRAALFTSTHKGAANQAYNVNNGDTFRWSHIWPKIAAWFGNEAGPPLKVPLQTLMKHHVDTWKAIQDKHGLKIKNSIQDIVDFEIGDWMFSCDCDLFSDTTKLRQAGFNLKVATNTQFYKWFNELADRGLIPRGPGYEKGAKLPPPGESLVKLQRQP